MKLRPEYGAVLVVAFVVLVAAILGMVTPQLSIDLPGVTVMGMFFAALLIFAVPYLASVRYSSPTAFDAEGRSWSFADGEIRPFVFKDTDYVAIAVGGYDAPKKLLSYDDIGGKTTTLLIAPAQLVEEVGKRFYVIRAAMSKMTPHEARLLLANDEFDAVKASLGVAHAEIWWTFASKADWLVPSRRKPRIDFTRIGQALAITATELSARGEVVQEEFRRSLADMERIARRSPPIPPRIDMDRPKQDEEKDE